MKRIYIAIVLVVPVVFILCISAAQSQSGHKQTTLVRFVKPINWVRFATTLPQNENRELCAQILINSARCGIRWIEDTYKLSPDKDRYLVPSRNSEHVIRPPASVAEGLSTVLKTGIYRNAALGCGKGELTLRTARLIKGVAAVHKANGGKWGNCWQSSHWAAQIGRAGWMLWGALDDEAKEMVCRVVEYEADRHLRKGYQIPYWNGKGGDSKAEENSWEAMVLQLAVVMMPEHPNSPRWKAVCSELMIGAYARKSDMSHTGPKLDGKFPREWLRGFNIREDGIVINHDRIHNDYMSAIAHLQMQGFLVCSLAEVPVPETTDFNFEVLYRALMARKFESPPYQAPGGSMYIPGKPEQYYPEGTDWSRFRFVTFYLMDTYTHVLGYDKNLPIKAKEWMKIRGEKILSMQLRHSDGHLYANGEFDLYPGREQFVTWSLGDAYLLQWLADQGALSKKGNWLADSIPK